MTMRTSIITVLAALIATSHLDAAELVQARDGSGIVGYKDTPKLPWCDYLVHDPDRPAPPKVHPGPFAESLTPPADAVVLFDGGDLSAFKANRWSIDSGELVAGEGSLTSLESFGDCQIHLEWQTPADFDGHAFDRGNNGVMLMGLFEIQIFESWHEKLYPDGQAAAIYGQTPPMVNACRPPGEWQSYDIVFTAPKFEGDRLVSPARVTVLHNGVLVHLDQEIHGKTGHRVLPEYPAGVETGPLVLYGHNCPVRFRNIWVRPFDSEADR